MRTSPRSGREAASVSAGRFIRISPFAGTSMVWLHRHSFGVTAPSDLANKNAATRKPAVNPFDQRTFDWNFIGSAFRKERESAGKGKTRRSRGLRRRRTRRFGRADPVGQ